jgi:hypothetical protein
MQPTQLATTEIIKRKAPANLIICSKLPRAEKMAIFENRKRKILRFLIEENYSSLENLANLLTVPKQTVLRITKHLRGKQYLTKTEIDIGLARPISVFQPTPTGIMFCTADAEILPELRELSKVNAATIYHDLQLQKIRLNLEKQGYTNFKSSWQLTRDLRKRKEKAPKIPDYICNNRQNERIAIEYERTIKTTKRYREIIGQYLDIRERGVIKKVQYITDHGFANKLKQMFNNINIIYRHGKTEKLNHKDLDFFSFVEVS